MSCHVLSDTYPVHIDMYQDDTYTSYSKKMHDTCIINQPCYILAGKKESHYVTSHELPHDTWTKVWYVNYCMIRELLHDTWTVWYVNYCMIHELLYVYCKIPKLLYDTWTNVRNEFLYNTWTTVWYMKMIQELYDKKHASYMTMYDTWQCYMINLAYDTYCMT